MLPTEEEMEVEGCCDKCKRRFFAAWNVFAMLLWAGFAAAFYMFRRDKLLQAECPRPWDMFLLVDCGIQVLYYFLAALSDCFQDEYGDTKPMGQRLHLWRLCCCLPVSFAWWVVGVVWFAAYSFECMDYLSKPAKVYPFFVEAITYLAVRFFQNSLTWCILCMQCCALNKFRKTKVSVETGTLPAEQQSVAASRSVQRWARVVGVKTVGIDALVGYAAAERYRRSKRDLEEGYKVYKLKKRGVRNIKVKHVRTTAEEAEAEAAKRLEGHTPVFPFIRLTQVIRQKDIPLDQPFKHLKGSGDLMASHKAARVIALAAARVAERKGAHAVGVAARRGL